MSFPRHLWSGDWERDSAAAAQALADHVPTEVPTEPAPPPPVRPKRPSLAARIRRALARIVKRTALAAAVPLLSAGAAYAVVSSLVEGSDNGRTAAVAQKPAWLGVQTTVSPILVGGFQTGFGPFPFATGVLVTQVAPGSPAARAGLQAGDVITQMGSQPVGSPEALAAVIAAMHAGQSVQLFFDRGAAAQQTQVTLGTR